MSNVRGRTVLALVFLAVGGAVALLAGGIGSLLVWLGLVALGSGLYVAVTGRRSWLRLRSRKVGAAVLIGGLLVTSAGLGAAGATLPPAQVSRAAATATVPAPPVPVPFPPPAPGPTSAAPQPGAEPEPSVVAAPPDGPAIASTAPRAAGSALQLLDTLAVKGRAPKTGYDRAGMFGTAWLDVDRNGCDTRNDILQRDLTAEVLSGPCKVLSGRLADPYTGKQIDFVRGNTTSTAVQIDHVVALMDAWQKGAQQLSQQQRITFANDPLNLWAVDGPTNSQKSDGDAATWLPPNKGFRCQYVARQVAVKAAYGLWVTQAERDAIGRILATCPAEPAPTSAFAAAAAPPTKAAAPAAPQPAAEPAGPAPAPPAPPSDVYYANCAAARAAGAAPVLAGQPGYSRKLDRDGDGIGCE